MSQNATQPEAGSGDVLAECGSDPGVYEAFRRAVEMVHQQYGDPDEKPVERFDIGYPTATPGPLAGGAQTLAGEILSRLSAGCPVGVVVHEHFEWDPSSTFLVDLSELLNIDPEYAGLLKSALLAGDDTAAGSYSLSASQGEGKPWDTGDWDPRKTGVALPVYGVITVFCSD